ncbi:hypothetical protein GCM10022225_37960 [Plantactinospora mayteni]|uniref:Uncharacterized protein n=1 Tax=Plantactinospora mayteni TaxID=566021 RepID=A0ABQ4F4A7_9ACTN|nr:hypothetical protein Pma05_83210 [Plantactinospora mayteni]
MPTAAAAPAIIIRVRTTRGQPTRPSGRGVLRSGSGAGTAPAAVGVGTARGASTTVMADDSKGRRIPVESRGSIQDRPAERAEAD